MKRLMTPATIRSALCWFALAVPATMLWAADAKLARATLFKNDGTTVAGEVAETSPAGVMVKTSPKAEPVQVRWSDIKRISNGLTQQKVIDEWKLTKADRLCETCHGDTTQACDICHGKAVDPTQAKACEACHGSGDTGMCPKCKEGKIACPDKCLKAASFSGTPDAEGKRWRLFRGKSGSLRISDGHVGEIVAMEKGDPVMKGKCPTCQGTTTAACPACHGTAKKECAACHGVGMTGPACAACKTGKIGCKTCDGAGLKTSKPVAGT